MVEYNLSFLNKYNKLQITNNSIILKNKRFGKTKIKNSSIDSVKLSPAQLSTKKDLIFGFTSGFIFVAVTINGLDTLTTGVLIMNVIILALYILLHKYFGKLTIYTRSGNYKIIDSRHKCQQILGKL